MKPGPAKGSGGRPRVAHPKPNGEGYIQVTKGPKSNGTRVYEHRAKMGLGAGSKSKGAVVDHKDGNRQNNAKSNIHVITKSANTAKSNKRR